MIDAGLIVPIGDVETELLENLAEVLSDRFSIPFNIGETLPIPEEVYNPDRNQYYSTAILKLLGRRYSSVKVLGIIDKDLYVPELNFVFGEADLSGRLSVISITRLRQQFYGLPKDDVIFLDRVIKEAVHELGHTYGLRHCSNSGCVMFFSNSLLDTDKKGSSFCRSCSRKMEALQ